MSVRPIPDLSRAVIITRVPGSAPAARRGKGSLFALKTPIDPGVYRALGMLSVSVIVVGWCVLSYGGVIGSDFLPTPTAVVAAFLEAVGDGSLAKHIWASASVVLTGFVLAALIAVPLGVLAGSVRVVEALVEPITNFVRYLPVTALIPLLILWVGIGTGQKVSVIFLGTVFNLTIMVADVSARVERSLLEAGFTLGASNRQALVKILFPACMPGIMDALRVNMGVAWTYVVVAELVSSSHGLGFMILNAMRGLFTDVIFMGIVVIGLLGLVFDQLLKLAKRVLLPWVV